MPKNKNARPKIGPQQATREQLDEQLERYAELREQEDKYVEEGLSPMFVLTPS